MTVSEKNSPLLAQEPRTAFPPGLTVLWAGGASSLTPPKGWLLCDGSAVPIDTYPALFAAIGTLYGAGDGSTTFNVPGSQTGEAFGLGSANLGSSDGSHSVAASGVFAGSHVHSVKSNADVTIGGNGGHNTNSANASTNGSSSSHNFGLYFGANGGGTSFILGNNNRISIGLHTHPNNYNQANNHNAGGHNVTSNLNAANHAHNQPTINEASKTKNSESFGEFMPSYLEMWYIIKT